MGNSRNLPQSPAPGRLRFKLTKFILCLGMMILLALFFMGGWLLLAGRLQKVVAATWGMVEKGCWTEVLYLREEQLLTAPAEGRLTLQVKNGTRVPKGEILAILDKKVAGRQNTTISNFNRQSYRHYQTLVQREAALNRDLRRINADLLNHLKTVDHRKNVADLQALQQEKEEVIRNIQVIHAQLVSFQQELAPVLQRWGFIIAEKPGSFVTDYDGWESTLTPEYFDQLTLNDFNRNYQLQSGGRQVKAGEIFGRLVNPLNQMMAVKITARKTGVPTVGTVWRFKTPGGWKSAPLTSVKMFDRQTGVAGVTLQTEETDLLRSRFAKMFVVYQKITGVTIPVQALYKRENLTVVRVAKGSGYHEKIVQVLGNDGGKAVVSGLEVGAMIISR
jgi:multidrug efflux pump subunit AcrA (membrane-fusion protein)